MKILFINACVRGEQSNTLKLCRAALEEMKQANPTATVSEIDLNVDRPQPLHPEIAEERSLLRSKRDLSHPMFHYARQFATADQILIGAPYWDLSFPSVLRIFLELICVVDITFAYREDGNPYGLCKAAKLLYITTAGGPIKEGYNMGYDYIKGLCNAFFGIPDLRCFQVEGLDMPQDIQALMREAEERLRAMLQGWS